MSRVAPDTLLNDPTVTVGGGSEGDGSAVTAAVAANGSLPLGFSKLLVRCGRAGGDSTCSNFISNEANRLFQALRESSAVNEPLSDEELQAYHQRFQDVLTGSSKGFVSRASVSEKYSAWRRLVSRSFSTMRPVVSRALVDEINQADLGWKASFDPDLPRVSVAHAAGRLGLLTGPEEERAILDETRRNTARDMKEIGNSKEPEGPFDVREHWPQCKEVSSHVRFQTCNNCWSHSTALVSESRLCIASDGRFKGRGAWLSQSFIATCRPDGQDYCAGASGMLGFTTVNVWGVPTGGPDFRGNAQKDITTCYPQIEPYQGSPGCPNSCSPYSNYPRKLQQDLFQLRYQPRALHPRAPQTLFLVKKSLMEEGPILIGLNAYQDLYAYQSGIYRPSNLPSNKKVGGHAVTGMGFGPGYILCVNSWGASWGLEGAFQVAPEAIDFGYFLPGKLAVQSMPMPTLAS